MEMGMGMEMEMMGGATGGIQNPASRTQFLPHDFGSFVSFCSVSSDSKATATATSSG